MNLEKKIVRLFKQIRHSMTSKTYKSAYVRAFYNETENLVRRDNSGKRYIGIQPLSGATLLALFPW